MTEISYLTYEFTTDSHEEGCVVGSRLGCRVGCLEGSDEDDMRDQYIEKDKQKSV